MKVFAFIAAFLLSVLDLSAQDVVAPPVHPKWNVERQNRMAQMGRAPHEANNEPAALPDKASNPQVIRVGIYVMNVGKFDIGSGAYTADFYLSLRSTEEIREGSFEFMNGRGSMELISNEKKGDLYEKYYRVQANLYQNVDLKAYPFDHHALTIELEDKNLGTSKVVYLADNDPQKPLCGIDPKITIVGWNLMGFDAHVEDHAYTIYDENYSRFVFVMAIRRVALATILKAFLPISFILFIGLLSLMIAADKVAMRFGLNTSMLLAAVMFHLNVTSSLPPVGYLTVADKFMFVSYVSLVMCLGSTMLLMRHTDKGEENKAKWIFRTSLMLVPLITAGLFFLLAVFSRPH